jgi:hypothetical protein
MKIRATFKSVDELISSMKLATIKNKTRISTFKQIGTPPSVVITRWSSWLKAALYYGENLIYIKKLVSLWEDDGILIQNVKFALDKEDLFKNLVIIKRNYECLVGILDDFENSKYDIRQGFEAVKNIHFKDDLSNIKNYLLQRIEKNDGYRLLNSNVSTIITPALYVSLLKCPSTSIAVERSFSMLHKMLTKDRNFLSKNIFEYFCFYYNHSFETESGYEIVRFGE